MRALGRFALAAGAMALSAASLTSPFSRNFASFGPIVLGGGGGETDEDRRRRNLAAGGRDKRIKRNKSRRSLPLRRSRVRRPLALSNPFTKQARKDAFDHYLGAGLTRNEAAKLARRVSA